MYTCIQNWEVGCGGHPGRDNGALPATERRDLTTSDFDLEPTFNDENRSSNRGCLYQDTDHHAGKSQASRVHSRTSRRRIELVTCKSVNGT
jgi:hypothetical protein